MTAEPTADGTVQPEPASIEEAEALLGTLADLDVAEHPRVFEAVHRVLRDQLAGSSGTRG
ncbi:MULTISPECIES: hypothetical protein [Aeromicrobium]|uniref:hypothetical protein n=1 Tax=Aeromicrobium TaxID=2040 RepID=UPI00257B6EE3|nr:MULTISPECIES: hypothetical protein [Aeromicrobium]